MSTALLVLPLLVLTGALPTARAADAVAQPSTQPAAPVVMLWPNDPPATQAYDSGDELRPRRNSAVVDLWKVTRPSMAVYLPGEAATGPRAAVVICPGGGYRMESVTTEGVDVARQFVRKGVAAFVLRYRLPDGRPPAEGQLPVPQQDVLRAIQIVRSRAAEFGVAPNRVGVLGFSAGGHLAATAATMFDQAKSFSDKAGSDAVSQTPARPDFAVLIYPVITFDGKLTHTGSRRNLVGENADPTLEARFSADKLVTADTPPLWILHAEDDKTVPVANSVMMAAAAAEQKVPCELTLLHAGGHGFGLGRPGSEADGWFERMTQWMATRKIIAPGS